MLTFPTVAAALETAEPFAEYMLECSALPVARQPRFWCISSSCPLAHFITRCVRGISDVDVNKDNDGNVFVDWYALDLDTTASGSEKTYASCETPPWCTQFVDVLDANHIFRNTNDTAITVRHVLIILRDAAYLSADLRQRIAAHLVERI